MILEDHIQHAHHYQEDSCSHDAWPFSDVVEVIDAIFDRRCAIVNMAVAYAGRGVVSECLPTGQERHYRLIQDRISRNLPEDWSHFIQRARKEGDRIQQNLLEDLRSESDIILASGTDILCRVTWYDEKAQQARFGRNLIELVEGEPHEPEDGRDQRDIRYLFGSKGFLDEGRRLFDLAEQLAAEFKTNQTRTADFLQSECKKVGSIEDSAAEIVAFTMAFDDFENLRIFAYLNEVEPDPDNLLHGYWEVELDAFTPNHYGGVVSTISRSRLGP